MDTMIIGIAGGTGSGKTTLTKKLQEEFGAHVSVLYHDNYYKSHSEMPFEERTRLNYDHPDAFDTGLMIRDIQALQRGETIRCPVYDYTIHDRSGETVEVRPTKVILVEGILIFENKALRDLMDIKIFVDTDADVRILRRITRDVKKRGRSLDCGQPVSHHRQAHARAVRGALQTVCRHRGAGGRPQPGGPGYDHPAHQKPCGGGRDAITEERRTARPGLPRGTGPRCLSPTGTGGGEKE